MNRLEFLISISDNPDFTRKGVEEIFDAYKDGDFEFVNYLLDRLPSLVPVIGKRIVSNIKEELRDIESKSEKSEDNEDLISESEYKDIEREEEEEHEYFVETEDNQEDESSRDESSEDEDIGDEEDEDKIQDFSYLSKDELDNNQKGELNNNQEENDNEQNNIHGNKSSIPILSEEEGREEKGYSNPYNSSLSIRKAKVKRVED